MNAKVKKEEVRKAVSSNVKTQLDAISGFSLGSIGSLIAEGGKPNPADAGTGEAPMIEASRLRKSPTQPRKKIIPEVLEDIRATIRARMRDGKRPIKVPLIIAPHPTEPGMFEVKDGHTRWAAGELEGVEFYPYNVDEEFDVFDQFMVNVKRAGHSPLETRDWINMRIEEGFSKKDIAEKAGFQASWISKHMKLNDMPRSLSKAHDEDRCNDLEALYFLTTQYERYPDQIDEFVNTSPSITQQSARAFIDSIKPDTKPPAPPPPAVGGNGTLSGNGGLDSTGGGGGNGGGSAGAGGKDPDWPFPVPQTGQSAPANTEGAPAGENGAGAVSGGSEAGAAKPGTGVKPKRPEIRVQYKKRDAVLLIGRAAENGAVWIKYEDDETEFELPANSQITVLGTQAK